MTEMQDSEVEIYPAGDDQADVARRLLDAAAELDLPAEVVRTVSDGGFRAPKNVADRAGVTPDTNGQVDRDEDSTGDAQRETVKRAGRKPRA